MPTPEELGVSCGPTDGSALDWTIARRRLDSLGAACFQLEKLSSGGYRFTCLLLTGQPNRTHRVEAQAATEAEAVRLVLERAERWAGQKK